MTTISAAHYSEVDMARWRWPNFMPRELASRGGGSLVLSVNALDALQALRTIVGAPLIITSAYRDPIHNALVGGAPLSRHKKGDAFDILTTGHDRSKLLQLAIGAGFRGFGFYQTFLHVDIGRPRHWFGGDRSRALWNGLVTSLAA